MTIEQQRLYLRSAIIDDIVRFIMEEENIDIINAMQKIYQSPVVRWLEDPEQDLCSQSSAYVYQLYKRYPTASQIP